MRGEAGGRAREIVYDGLEAVLEKAVLDERELKLVLERGELVGGRIWDGRGEDDSDEAGIMLGISKNVMVGVGGKTHPLFAPVTSGVKTYVRESSASVPNMVVL